MQSGLEQVLKRARTAQAIAATWSQEMVDDVVAAVGFAAWHEGGTLDLAGQAVAESGLGRAEDLAERHRIRVLGLLGDLHGVRSCGLVERDARSGVMKFAQPVGVVAMAIPATAPTASVAGNALTILKTRNAAVFCPNPRCAGVAGAMTEIMRRTLVACGVPADLLQCLADPNRELMNQLMAASDLVIATGGQGVVKRAQAAATPCYTAGIGNSVILVDETADIGVAAANSLAGKSFDNGTSCSAESVLVIQDDVWEPMIYALIAEGGYLCTTRESERLARTFWPQGPDGPRRLIGRSAAELAAAAEIPAGTDVRALLVAPEAAPEESLFSGEKLAPILALWRYRTFDEGVESVRRILDRCGRGHSCGIYSRVAGRPERLAETLPVSRIMCNHSTGLGNAGSPTNGMPFTTTLSCGSWGGGITTANVTWRNLVNLTWLAHPIERPKQRLADLFGRHFREMEVAD